MTRTSALQSILIDQHKRIQLLIISLAAFCFFHILVMPFQLSYYSTHDFVKVNVAYNLIAVFCLCVGFIAVPKLLPNIYDKIAGSIINRIAYLIFHLVAIGVGIFIFKIAFGYYDFELARIGTGVFALIAFGVPIGLVAYTIDTKFDRTKLKELSELTYWKIQKFKTSTLNNDHYEEFYTKTFGLKLKDYSAKKVLDIGCGPRGSLEWVPDSTVAIGLDPLAESYLELYSDTDPLKMELVQGYCEAIPFEDESFDIVASFNSLDHVEDLEQSTKEIQRVIKPGGLLLLICDVNRKATLTEPHNITPHLLMDYFKDLHIKEKRLILTTHKLKIWANVRENNPLQDINDQGVLIAKFQKV